MKIKEYKNSKGAEFGTVLVARTSLQVSCSVICHMNFGGIAKWFIICFTFVEMNLQTDCACLTKFFQTLRFCAVLFFSIVFVNQLHIVLY